jgi:hypothetical protein
MPLKLMPHQEEVVSKLSNGKILWGGVGSGKSIAALYYYINKELIGDIYVITTAKKRDSLEWERDAAKFGIGKKPDSTVAGVMTVDSWNNISKYEEVENAFFIFDEQRLVGSGAWVKSFYKIAKNNPWILLTATPGDNWLDYIPVFVANGFYKNMTQFKQEHVVYAPYSRYPRVLRYIGETKLERLKQQVLVEMPYKKHTERILEKVEVEYDEQKFKDAANRRWNIFEDAPCKDFGELFRVLRRISSSNVSRLVKINELIDKHGRLIVFYNFNYELDILRSLSDVATVAEWNGHKKQPIPDTDEWVYLVQYTAGAEGWNCIETNAMVFYSLTYSYKSFEQAQGRIDRLNTPYDQLYYYVLVAKSWTDMAILKKLDEKKDFNEREFGSKYFGY